MNEAEATIRAVRLRRERVPSFERYPFDLPAVSALHELELHPAVTYFVGENGTGKSTLLEALAVRLGFNPEGGTRFLPFETRSSHSDLHRYLDLVPEVGLVDGFFFRAESFFNLATEVERSDREIAGEHSHLLTQKAINSFGGRALHEQSHGESFFATFQNRFRRPGVYLLDEPEAALSPTRQMALLTVMHHATRSGSQLVVATHSPIVLAYPQSRIYRFSEEGIAPVAYEETESYQVTRDFLDHREAMLRVLLEEDGEE